jgi:TatA/E family protein of Tat protein translocase
MNLGPAEILVICLIGLIVFGPKKLPEVGRQVGAAMREFRKVQDSVKSEINSVLHADSTPTSSTRKSTSSGTSERPAPAPAAETSEPDHTMLPAPPPPPEPAADADDGFGGPSGSFT